MSTGKKYSTNKCLRKSRNCTSLICCCIISVVWLLTEYWLIKIKNSIYLFLDIFLSKFEIWNLSYFSFFHNCHVITEVNIWSTFSQHIFRTVIGTCRVPMNQILTLKHRVDAFIVIHVKIVWFLRNICIL